MAPSAVIAQTIGCEVGRAALFCLAGEDSLHNLKLFQDPPRCAFSGVTAFKKGDQKDPVYSAMQSVVSKSVGLAEWYDRNSPQGVPDFLAIIFPLIVLEGELYEAYFDPGQSKTALVEVNNARVHWRGAERKSIATFDIVKELELDSYVSQKKQEITLLTALLVQSARQIRDCYAKGTLEGLEIKKGARGFLGLPHLLAEIHRKSLSAQEEQQNKSRNQATSE